MSRISTLRQIAYDIAVIGKLFDPLSETGAVGVPSGQAERHIGAKRGCDLLQTRDRPIEIPQGVQRQQCGGRIGGSARHAGSDGNALFDVQRHVRFVAAGLG